MKVPNLPVELMFKQVRKEVKLDTEGRQSPWYEASIDGDFYFNKSSNDNDLVVSNPPKPSTYSIANNESYEIDIDGVWEATSGSDAGERITIRRRGNNYVVVSYIDSDGEVFKILSSSYSGGVLKWSYLVPSTGYELSFEVDKFNRNKFIAAYSGRSELLSNVVYG